MRRALIITIFSTILLLGFNDYSFFHETEQETIGEDQEEMVDIVHGSPNIVPGMVMIVGENAWINIMFENKVREEEQDALVQDLEMKLKEAIPNYTYQIIINEFMHPDQQTWY